MVDRKGKSVREIFSKSHLRFVYTISISKRVIHTIVIVKKFGQVNGEVYKYHMLHEFCNAIRVLMKRTFGEW